MGRISFGIFCSFFDFVQHFCITKVVIMSNLLTKKLKHHEKKTFMVLWVLTGTCGMVNIHKCPSKSLHPEVSGLKAEDL